MVAFDLDHLNVTLNLTIPKYEPSKVSFSDFSSFNFPSSSSRPYANFIREKKKKKKKKNRVSYRKNRNLFAFAKSYGMNEMT